MISRLSIFISLLSYIYMGSYITARKVFIVSSYFAMLNQSMVFFWPYSLSKVAEAYVSFQRVQEFLLMSEEKMQATPNPSEAETSEKVQSKLRTKDALPQSITADSRVDETTKLISDKEVTEWRMGVRDGAEKSIIFKNATAYWVSGDESSVGIQNVSLEVRPQELCAVVGPVGSGKSSLLQVILGELQIDSGRMHTSGSISYAAQENWLFEGTIRSNIVFIEDFNAERYNHVIKVCALDRDFALLPSGDMAIVGERGITLSGGQKARVSLARAIYKKADIYLLDDPLSAVDTHVGQHLFKECIEGFLADKIRILVTHQLQHLASVKNLVLLNKGTVEQQGSYDELRDLKLERLSLLPAFGVENESGTNGESRSRSASTGSIKHKVVDHAIDEIDRAEKQGIGAVSWKVYKEYIRTLSGLQYVVILFVLSQIGMTGLEFFIARW